MAERKSWPNLTAVGLLERRLRYESVELPRERLFLASVCEAYRKLREREDASEAALRRLQSLVWDDFAECGGERDPEVCGDCAWSATATRSFCTSIAARTAWTDSRCRSPIERKPRSTR